MITKDFPFMKDFHRISRKSFVIMSLTCQEGWTNQANWDRLCDRRSAFI